MQASGNKARQSAGLVATREMHTDVGGILVIVDCS